MRLYIVDIKVFKLVCGVFTVCGHEARAHLCSVK